MYMRLVIGIAFFLFAMSLFSYLDLSQARKVTRIRQQP